MTSTYQKLRDVQSTRLKAGSNGKTKAVLKQSSLVQTEGFIIVGPDLCQFVHTLSDEQILPLLLLLGLIIIANIG